MVSIISFPDRMHDQLAAPSSTTPPTIDTLIEPWCAARHADGFQPRGIARYADHLHQFIDWAGPIPVTDLTVSLIRTYKVCIGGRVGAGTTRNALSALRAFCTWCVEEDYLTENPALGVKHPKVIPPDPNPLTREGIRTLLALLDKPPRSHKLTWARNRRCVYLMLYAGLRREEVAKLQWGDVDLERREIIVRKSKGGKSRTIPICRELAEELANATDRTATQAVVDQGDGRPLTHKSLGHIFERWVKGRGMTISPHQLRRTFATELYRRSVDIFTIQRLLGHSDPKTTLRYIGASSEIEHAAVELLQLREKESTS